MTEEAKISSQEKYLQWQIECLKEKQNKSNKYWEKESLSKCRIIDSLKTKIETLQEELKATKERTKQEHDKVKNELDLSQNKIKQLILKMDDMRESFDKSETIHRTTVGKLEGKLKTLHEQNQSLAKVLQEKENAILSMQKDFDEKLAMQYEEADKTLKNQAEKYEFQVKKKLDQMEKEKKRMAKNLEDKQNLIEKQRQEIETFEIKSKTMCKILEEKLKNQKQKTNELKNRPTLEEAVAKLHETIRAKDNKIAQCNCEIGLLKQEKKEIHEKCCTEKDNNAMLSAILEDMRKRCESLEKEKATEQYNHKQIEDQLNKAKQNINDLIENSSLLIHRMNANKSELKNLNFKVKSLEKYQQRFKEDLQVCISVMGDHKEFIRRMVTLRKRYLDNDKTVQIDAETKASYENQIHCLMKNCSRFERVRQTNCAELGRAYKMLEEKNQNQEKINSKFITLHNDKIVEIRHLKKDLKDTTYQLQKAQKAAEAGCGTWANRVVLPSIKCNAVC